MTLNGLKRQFTALLTVLCVLLQKGCSTLHVGHAVLIRTSSLEVGERSKLARSGAEPQQKLNLVHFSFKI